MLDHSPFRQVARRGQPPAGDPRFQKRDMGEKGAISVDMKQGVQQAV